MVAEGTICSAWACARLGNGGTGTTELRSAIAAYTMSSATGLIPQPGNTPYCTSKWGIVGFSLSLAALPLLSRAGGP